MNYTKNELLEYARINYLPGTIFKSCTGKNLEVKGTDFVMLSQGQISVETTSRLGTGTFNGHGAAVYFIEKGWAEIIKKKSTYEIY